MLWIGLQRFRAGRVIPNFFNLCPNAETATKVATDDIEKVIQSLGLQKKRALMIQPTSTEYLEDTWTHVTQLHGVGKYAADAYAIFCTDKWEQVGRLIPNFFNLCPNAETATKVATDDIEKVIQSLGLQKKRA
ncbi:hypothetical protein QQ045_007836 [Rhodiola kirilowii]